MIYNRARAIKYRQENNEAVGGFFSQIGDLYVVHHLWGEFAAHKLPQSYFWHLGAWFEWTWLWRKWFYTGAVIRVYEIGHPSTPCCIIRIEWAEFVAGYFDLYSTTFFLWLFFSLTWSIDFVLHLSMSEPSGIICQHMKCWNGMRQGNNLGKLVGLFTQITVASQLDRENLHSGSNRKWHLKLCFVWNQNLKYMKVKMLTEIHSILNTVLLFSSLWKPAVPAGDQKLCLAEGGMGCKCVLYR